MSDLLTPNPATAPWPADKERRRPGRIENATPELIALMRNPASRANQVRIALYDAPGFMLPPPDASMKPRTTLIRAGVAIVASGAVWAVAFKAMLLAWG